MEKNRITKIIAIVALCVALLSVTIGFAAWSATLVINETSASISRGNEDTAFVNLITFGTPTCTPNSGASVQSSGTLDAASQTWTGASVTLSAPGQFVTCTSTVSNASSFIAYIKSINISNRINCTNTTSGQSVSSACDSLKLSVSATANSKTSTATAQGNTVTDALGITGSGIPAKNGSNNGTGTISFTIEYVSGGTVSDADFTATIPSMTFVLSTLD